MSASTGPRSRRTSVSARIGTCCPSNPRAGKAIWEAVNPKTGMRRIDEAFPEALRDATRSQEMFIKFRCGATGRSSAATTTTALVGSPPVGIVASEWALAKPAAWAYLRPILQENGGWIVFNTTPRGKNHAHRMLEGARDDPAWFTQVLTAKQTDVFTPEQLEQEKRELMREYGAAVGIQMFDRYMCSTTSQ